MNEYPIIIDIDTKPLVHCNPKVIKEEILQFLELFKTAPLCFHSSILQIGTIDMFWIYYTLKKYKPVIIIENNDISGDSISWLVKTVCPLSHIVSLYKDINTKPYINIHLNVNNKCRLQNFTDINWTEEIGHETCKSTLVINANNDDHYPIVSHAYQHNISNLIFTNNYPTTQGNCLTVKKILSNKYHLTKTNDTVDYRYIPSEFKNHLKQTYDYYEFPPIYLNRQLTRWNDYFSEHNCKYPLFEKEEGFLYLFNQKQLDYTFICLLKLK